MTVIATPGATNANSYATTADLDAYAETRPFAPDLSSKTEDEKGAALIDATRLHDQLRHRGSVRFWEGALQNPRYNLYDKSGRPYDSEVICKPHVEAVCETALSMLGGRDRRAEDPLLGKAKVVTGPLEVTADKHDRRAAIPDSAFDMIAHLVIGGGRGGISARGVLTG